MDKEVFLRLSEDSQARVEHIYCIAAILSENNHPPLDVNDFDRLYDKPVADLEYITGYVKRAVFADAYPDLEGE